MYDKSKKKLVLNIIGMASAVSVAVSMILMFRGILSQFIAMPIAIVSPAIGIMASFIKEWDWKEISGLKKAFYIFRLLFILSVSVFGLVMWFMKANQLRI